jgi:carboxyl-terminal processing protease
MKKRMILKQEIVSRYYYDEGQIISSLSDDAEINQAIKVLTDHKSYEAILDGTNKAGQVKKEKG